MLDQFSKRSSGFRRRQIVIAAGSALVLSPLGLQLCQPAVAAPDYAQTIDAMKKGVTTETTAHRRYVLFGQEAKANGYKGLAYLYTALATSELIHAHTYNRVLATLAEPPAAPGGGAIPTGTAKENLIYAAERELDSIQNTYPNLLRLVKGEGHSDAISAVEYSWASHKQHLEFIEKIRRWSPSFFESVARKIDEGTDRYYVCRICGSTVNKVPEDVCPVCNEPASNYRLIAPDRFY